MTNVTPLPKPRAAAGGGTIPPAFARRLRAVEAGLQAQGETCAQLQRDMDGVKTDTAEILALVRSFGGVKRFVLANWQKPLSILLLVAVSNGWLTAEIYSGIKHVLGLQ